VKTQLDEGFAIDVLGENARHELVADGVGERGATTGSALPLLRTHDLGAPRIEIEVQRPPLVLSEGLVIQVAKDVPGYVAHDESHDLLVDSAFAVVQRGVNRLVERRG